MYKKILIWSMISVFSHLCYANLLASCETDFAFDLDERNYCQEISRATSEGIEGRPYGVESNYLITLSLNSGIFYASHSLPCSELWSINFPDNNKWQMQKSVEICKAFERFYLRNGLQDKNPKYDFSNMIYRASVQARKYFPYGEKYCEAESTENLSTCIGIVDGIKKTNQPYLTYENIVKLPSVISINYTADRNLKKSRSNRNIHLPRL